jgi:hypothetical protein
MSLNVAGLTAYVNQERLPLIRKMVLEGRTPSWVTVVPGVKSSASINLLDTTLNLQTGSCGWQDSGSTILSQVNLSTCVLKYQESICLDTLEQFYLQVQMNPGSYNKEIPFEEIFVLNKVENISKTLDQILWQGNTTGGAGNLALCDGWIKLANTTYSGSVVDGNVTNYTSITPSNIIAIVDEAISVIPADVTAREDLILYCGYDFARTYQLALRNANIYNYPSIENGNRDFILTIPASNVRLVAQAGLNGSNKFFISPISNMYMATDLLQDFEQFEIWYSQDFQSVRTNARFKAGVNFAFPSYVVYWKI